MFTQPFFSAHPSIAFIIGLLIVWTLIWKGLALWLSARKGQKGWFIAMLILNTAGILEILYLYVFSRQPEQTTTNQPQ